MTSFRIELWDQDQFKNSQDVWTTLLNDSTADPLFMSWEWMYTWWNVYSNSSMLLQLIAVYSEKDTLLGLAPLFSYKVTAKKIIKTNRLQFIGDFWRVKSTMRTELQEFIVCKENEVNIVTFILNYINSLNYWDEFVISELNTQSATYKTLTSDKPLHNSYYRIAESYSSYYLKIIGTFDEYCKSLGKNTRLKFLNRRTLLKKQGEVKFIESTSQEDIESNFNLLNSLHSSRWQKDAFKNETLRFNAQLANLMAPKNGLSFSIILLDEKPISIQYNYVVNGHKYNLQAGFDENFHKKISLGYLHFGYSIELAYTKGLHTYDFLAGEGKNTQYKARLTKSSLDIVTLQVIRKPFAKLVYITFDFLAKYIFK